MSSLWLAIVLVALVSFALKAAGPALLGDGPLPARVATLIALLAPALLAALVVTDIAGPGWSEADWTLAAGLTAAALAYLCRAPGPVSVAVAVVVTAMLRVAF